MDGNTQALIVALVTAVVAALTKTATSRRRSKKRDDGPRRTTPSERTPSEPSRPRGKRTSPSLSDHYPGDFAGRVSFDYAPHADREPDPGEVVWTWVPYEEDATQGKDRPALLVGRDGDWLLGLMLTSKDHDRDTSDEARHGRHWLDLGTGSWDQAGRPSEVRLDRVIRVDPRGVRREGAVLDRSRFDDVARAVREIKGW